MPWRRSRRMRQRDAVDAVPTILDGKFSPNRFDQRTLAEKLPDRELAHGQHEFGLQQCKFTLEPRRTVRDLLGRRDAIAAFSALARKTSAHRRKINPLAHRV